MSFESQFAHVGHTVVPSWTGLRVMMMPLVAGDLYSVPERLENYYSLLHDLFDLVPQHKGEVVYLTIDEKRLKAGETHRRAGLHVDGIYKNGPGGWGGGWGKNGMLTVSNVPGCEAWRGTFEGWPGPEGECDHLADQLPGKEGELLLANRIYHVSGLCVHESVPALSEVERSFIRLSMPSDCPWFEGYTENPLGVLPTGPILPRRSFMDC